MLVNIIVILGMIGLAMSVVFAGNVTDKAFEVVMSTIQILGGMATGAALVVKSNRSKANKAEQAPKNLIK